jgi:hypothetical protein
LHVDNRDAQLFPCDCIHPYLFPFSTDRYFDQTVDDNTP